MEVKEYMHKIEYLIILLLRYKQEVRQEQNPDINFFSLFYLCPEEKHFKRLDSIHVQCKQKENKYVKECY